MYPGSPPATPVNFIDEPVLADSADTAAAIRRPLVAVLPFQVVGEDASLHLLAEEIAEELREQLTRDAALQAILISSDFLAQAPPHALELVCRELRVGYLVTGKCHAGPGGPSLYMELTDTRDWHIHWAQFYRERARTLLADGSVAMSALVTDLRRVLVEHPVR